MDLKDIYSFSRMGDITKADLQNAIARNQTGVPPFFRGGTKAAGTPVYTGTGTGIGPSKVSFNKTHVYRSMSIAYA